MKPRGCSVYEALNHARKEVFVGVTRRPLVELIEKPRKGLPAEIAHWDAEETVAIRVLSAGLPAAEAWEFAGIYVSCYIEREGWRVLRQSASD